MAKISIRIQIDSDIKEQASELFRDLGLDMSTAVNIFLHQCVLRGGLLFYIKMPSYRQETLDAMEEAELISKDPNIKGFTNMEDLRQELEE